MLVGCPEGSGVGANMLDGYAVGRPVGRLDGTAVGLGVGAGALCVGGDGPASAKNIEIDEVEL